MISTFITSDPDFASSSLHMAGSFTGDLFPFIQPIIVVGIVAIAVIAIVKMIKH